MASEHIYIQGNGELPSSKLKSLSCAHTQLTLQQPAGVQVTLPTSSSVGTGESRSIAAWLAYR